MRFSVLCLRLCEGCCSKWEQERAGPAHCADTSAEFFFFLTVALFYAHPTAIQILVVTRFFCNNKDKSGKADHPRVLGQTEL